MISSPERGFTPESALKRVVIQEVEPAHIDRRRAIIEYYDAKEQEPSFANQKVIKINEVVEGEPMVLGQHYHNDRELFYLLSGQIDEIILEDVDTNERMIETNIGAGVKIFLPARVAHTLTFTQPSILLAANEFPFDANNLVPRKLK